MKCITTLALTEQLYVKDCVYVISMSSQGHHTIASNILGFFMYLLIIWNIFSRLKIKKLEIVMYGHENMSPHTNVLSWPPK